MSKYQPTKRYQPTMQRHTSTQGKRIAQYQSTTHYQPTVQCPPTTQYQPMSQCQPTIQYQPNQLPVMRQEPTIRNTAELSLPKNLEFDGKTNWILFNQTFESYAAAAGWTDDKKTDMLVWGLKGKAADFYGLLCNMNEDLSFKHLISEFGKRFKRGELPETLQARFQNECQDESETLRDWADRILTLTAKAYR